jgi:hypothetical protein
MLQRTLSVSETLALVGSRLGNYLKLFLCSGLSFISSSSTLCLLALFKRFEFFYSVKLCMVCILLWMDARAWAFVFDAGVWIFICILLFWSAVTFT